MQGVGESRSTPKDSQYGGTDLGTKETLVLYQCRRKVIGRMGLEGRWRLSGSRVALGWLSECPLLGVKGEQGGLLLIYQ